MSTDSTMRAAILTDYGHEPVVAEVARPELPDDTFALDDVADAYRYGRSGDANGKIAVAIR